MRWMLTCFLVASLGRAEQPAAPLTLDWRAPAGCPSGSAIRANVLRKAGTDGRTLLPVAVTVRVERVGEQYVLSLATNSGEGEAVRGFHAPTCEAVSEAASVTIALLLNPDAHEHRPVLAASEPSGAPQQKPGHRAIVSRNEPLRLGISLLTGVHAGIQPRWGPEFGGEVGALKGPFSLGFAGSYSPSQVVRVSAQAPAGGEFTLYSGAVYGCWAFWRKPTLGVCSGLEYRRVSTEGVGVTEPRRGHLHWPAGALGAQASFALREHVRFRLDTFVTVPFDRPAAYLDDIGVVFRPSAWGGRVRAGVVFQMP